MKNLATLFAMTFVGLGTALAQGTIDFHNPGGASGFPVTVIDAAGNVTKIGDTAAGSPLGPASVRVGLFVGANGTPFSGMTMVAEGVRTAHSACELAARHRVEMPIVEQVRRVLYDGISPHEAIAGLMARPLRGEGDR